MRQLYSAGLSSQAISRRLHAGRLHRIHRGVYAVGHTGLSSEGRWMAAVLACGEGAVLSHRSAAELWGMLERIRGPVEITVPVAGGRHRRDGIRIHRSPSLPNGATTRRRGIAVTTPARTLTDLGRHVSPAQVRRTIRQAEYDGLEIDDHGRRTEQTRSELEARFLRICRRHRLAEPEINVTIGRFAVDFLWRDARLIVETDGYRSHRGRQAFEDDRRRDNELTALGYEVLRFTYLRVVNEPARVVAMVRTRLDHRAT